MNRKILVGIAEDGNQMRNGLVAVLRNDPNIDVIFNVENGKALIDELKYSVPDVILLDISMPIMSGKPALEKIKAKYKSVKVIVLSIHSEDELILKFLKLGACAFLDKNVNFTTVINAIYSVHETGQFLNSKETLLMAKELRSLSQTSIIKNSTENFSETEIEILKYICKGKNSEEISKIIGMAEPTVEYYIEYIFEKAKISSLPELMEYAYKNNLVKANR